MRHLLLVSLMIFVSSCTKTISPQKTAEVKFLVADSTISTLSGGFVIFGTSTTGGTFVQKFDPTSLQQSISLPLGVWNFYALGILGTAATPLSGSPRCAVNEQYNVQNSSENISLSLGSANCKNAFFNDSFSSTGSVRPWTFIPCTDLTSVTAASVSCEKSPGNIQSYKVQLMTKDLTAATFSVGIESACISASAQGSIVPTSLTLPFPTLATSLITYKILAFSDSACSTSVASFDYSSTTNNIGKLISHLTDQVLFFLNIPTPAKSTYDFAFYDKSVWQ